uniref:KRAB domain-containing protein n=1 Tax=Laticauda laticaudata TaxID=8630 RepID=A0A8C5WU84_LATLA
EKRREKRETNINGIYCVFCPSLCQDLVSFEDVAVFFSVEEWALLESEQKALYQEVMLENKRIIASLAKGQIFYQLNMGFVHSRGFLSSSYIQFSSFCLVHEN